MRDKSVSKKRTPGAGSSTAQQQQRKLFSTSNNSHPSATLKSLLRVRLPASAKNGTIMSVYDPTDTPNSTRATSSSRPQSSDESSATRKRVLFVLDGETNPSHDSSSCVQSISNNNKHRINDLELDFHRATKERRLSDGSVTSPRSAREAQQNLDHHDQIPSSSSSSSFSPPPTSPSSLHSSTPTIPSPRLTLSAKVPTIPSLESTDLPDWMKLGRSYKGFCHFGSSPAPYDQAVPRVDYSSITPKEFFDQFVAPRRPCVLTLDKETETDLQGLAQNWTSNDYLKEKAGDQFIDVEIRDTEKEEEFGEGRKTKIAFGELLDSLEEGNEKYYVTTQRIKETREGPTRLGGDILHKTPLTNDFPNSPSIMGNLIPYQHNVWIGHSKEGSSTGLHHDFHDNLYLMIRGRKTFRLYSPRCGEILQTVGKIGRIHENGLISYDEMRRSDGADEASVLGWRAKQAKAEATVLKKRLKAIEEQVEKLENLIRHATQVMNRGNKNGQKRELKLKDLGAKKWIAMAKEFVLTKRFCIENLQSELNSKKESKRLLQEYIRNAESRNERFTDMKEDAELKRTVLEQMEGNGSDIDDSSASDEASWTKGEDMEDIDDEIDGLEEGQSEKSHGGGSLSFLESMMDDQMKKDLEEKREGLLLSKENNGSDVSSDEEMEDVGGKDDDDDDGDWIQIDEFEEEPDDCPIGVKPNHFCESNTTTRKKDMTTKGMIRSFPKSSNECPNSCIDDIRNQILQQYIEVTLEPTELLYLPASWFHEVISSSSSSERRKKASAGHMAFNFWFYPPATPTAIFNAPYIDEYWSNRYRHVLETMELERRKELLEKLMMNGGDWPSVIQLLQAGVAPEILGIDPAMFGDDDDVAAAFGDDGDDDMDEDTLMELMQGQDGDDSDDENDENVMLMKLMEEEAATSSKKTKKKDKKNKNHGKQSKGRKNSDDNNNMCTVEDVTDHHQIPSGMKKKYCSSN